MSIKNRSRKLLLATTPIALSLALSGPMALATTTSLYLDTNGITSGLGSGSPSTIFNWNAANQWATSTGGTTLSNWVANDDAVFSQSSSTLVAVAGGGVQADSLTFTGTVGYTFENTTNGVIGGTPSSAITLTDGSGNNAGITVNSSAKIFFDSPIIAASQVLFTSQGGTGATIDLGGDLGGISATNTFTNGIEVGSNGTSGAMRINFNSSGADGAGGVVNGNTIVVNSPDSTLTTLSGLNNQEYDVNSKININPTNYNPYNPSTHAWGFLVDVGATTFKAALSSGFMVWKGQITGNGGLVIGNGNYTSGGGNAVTVLANSTNNYTGPTYIGSTGGSFSGTTLLGNNAGSLRLGANNAVPADSDLVFGLPLPSGGKVFGNFDMAGYSDTVNSIQTPFYAAGSLDSMGITNSNIGQAGTSVLTIASTTDTSSTVHQFDSVIGAGAGNIGTENTTGTTQLANDNLAIVYNSPATLQLGAAATYTGGTTIQQGTIELADPVLAVRAGSLSSVGPVAFTGGGTLDLAGHNQAIGALSSNGSYGTVTNKGGISGGSSVFTVNVPFGPVSSFAGVIADGSSPIALTKTGVGTLALGGANTYSGATTVSAGTLLINGSTISSSAFTVASNAALGGIGTIHGSVTVQTGGIIAPGGLAPLTVNTLSVQGGAALNFALTSSANDSVNILQSGGLSFTGANKSSVDISGTPAATTYHLLDYTGSLTGGLSNLQIAPLPSGFSGQLALDSIGSQHYLDLVVTLYNGLTWKGTTDQNWNFTSNDWTSASSGNVYSDGKSVTFDDTGTGGTINITSTVSPSEIIFNNTAAGKSYTISGAAIAGTSSISLLNGGSVTLTGANTFSGPVSVSNGTLNFSSDANLGNSGNGVTLGNAIGQGTLGVTGTSFSSSRELTLNNTSTINVGGATNWTENGEVDGSGGLIKQGTGTLTLGFSGNTYNGSTTVSAGTLAAGAANAIPSGSDLTVAASAFFSTGGFNQTIGSIGGAGGYILGTGSTLTTGGDNSSSTVSGPVTGGGTLTKNGSGTLTLSNSGNTFGGGQTITVNGGTLAVTSDANLGASNNSIALADGTTLALNTGSASLTSSRAISVATGPVGTTTISFNTVNPSTTTTPTVALNGQITGAGGLTISGPGITPPVPGSSAVGVLTLGNTNNTFNGGLTINNAIVTPAAAGSLGAGNITLSNAVVNLPTSGATSDPVTIGNLGTTLNVASGSFTLNGIVAGGQNTGITKTGTGTLILNGAPSFYNGAWNINAGKVEVASTDIVDGGNQSPLGLGGTTGGLVQVNSVAIGNGGTLQLDVPVGQPDANSFSPLIFMANGGTLIGKTNAAAYGYDANPGALKDDASGGLMIDRGTVASPSTVTIGTASASDVLTIGNSVMQYDTTGTKSITGVSNATITVSGPGKVILQSGDVNSGGTTNNGSSATYAGSWNITGGILQLGPVVPDPNPLGTGGGPIGEPLNAFGFVSGVQASADPVKVSGGILAIGVDSPNENPNWAVEVGRATQPPNYLRAPIELAGGALASTGIETVYDPTAANPQGIPDPLGTRVTAEIGGGLTIDASTTSSVLTYDPSAPTFAASFEVVGGNVTWNGTLAVAAPASGVGGALNFAATTGTITVGSGAALTIAANSTVNVGSFLASGAGQTLTPVAGAIDPFTDSTTTGSNTNLSVAVTVNGTLNYAARTGIAGDTGIKTYKLGGLAVSSTGSVNLASPASSSNATSLITGNLNGAGSVALGLNALSVNNGGSFSGVISDGAAGGSLTSNGGTLTLSGANSYIGNTTVTGGTLALTSTGRIASTNLTVSAGAAANITGLLTANPSVIASGSAGVGSTVTFGATDIHNDPTSIILVRRLNSLTIGSGSTVALAPATTHATRSVLVPSTVTFSDPTNGTLNVSNNDLVLKTTSVSTASTELKAGFNAGSGYWNGASGIESSAAAGDATHLTTLGYLAGGSTFDGVSTTSSDVAVKYTYYGDANLDGTVNGADYQQIDLGFGSHLTGWQNGDFNYDGVVDGSDYSLIDNTFNQINASGASPLAITASTSAVLASSADLIASPASAVPEPTTLGLLGIGAIGLLGRRRRRNA